MLSIVELNDTLYFNVGMNVSINSQLSLLDSAISPIPSPWHPTPTDTYPMAAHPALRREAHFFTEMRTVPE